MKCLRTLGLATMVILSFAIAAASAAQAAELLALPVTLNFEFMGKAAELPVIKTLGGKSLDCKKLTGHGEFTMPAKEERLGPIELRFAECEEPTNGIKCTGLADTTGNISIKGEFHIRHLLKTPEVAEPEKAVNVAILLSAIHFSCGGVILFMMEGCLASMDLLTKAGGLSVINLLEETMFLEFLQSGGDGVPNSIDTDNSLGMASCVLLVKEGVGLFQSTGLLSSILLENFKSGGVKVTALIDLTGAF